MIYTRRKLHTFLFSFCLAGYIWLYYGFTVRNHGNGTAGVCIFRHITHIPCPSCGSTRSVMSLVEGNLKESLYLNPFGFLIALVMVVIPIWIIMDHIAKRDTLLPFYIKMEQLLKKRAVAVPLIVLVLINWIWNIYKGL